MKKYKIAGFEIAQIEGEPQGKTLLLFHGYGAPALDLVGLSQIRTSSPRPTWIFPAGPLSIPTAPGMHAKAWFPIDFEALHGSIDHAFPQDLSEIRTQTIALITALEIPLSNLILGGFSQGAVLATEIALYLPQNVAGIALFSTTLINHATWQERLKQRQNISFFLSHGLQDPLLPFARAQKLEKLFLEANWQGKLHAFKGGHEIPQSILTEFERFVDVL